MLTYSSLSHVKLPHLFTPRQYQSELMRAVFVDKYRHLYWIIHRRAGKTRTAINILCAKACEKPGLYLLIMPQTNQCRRVVWDGRGSDGVQFRAQIPGELIAKVNNSTMAITLHNGSIIQLVGSNNFDALMGINTSFIIYDEYTLQNPLAREYLSPILLESGGTELLLGTPRGHNHGWETYEMAINNPSWFVRKLTIEDTVREDGVTPVITQAQFEEEKASGKDLELLQQELYCSFDIGNKGAYYTAEMAQAEYEGRICDFEISRSQPVHLSLDIGVGDKTAIVFYQFDGNYVNYIDYLEDTGKGLDYYIEKIHEVKTRHGFTKWGYMWAPHDIKVREWGNSAQSRLRTAEKKGINFLITPNLAVQDRIDAGRGHLRKSKFHRTNCRQLLICLREAMREYDEEERIFKPKPLKNWALHGFDAYTYSAVSYHQLYAQPELNAPRKFQNHYLNP